jgi:hypothetical protein
MAAVEGMLELVLSTFTKGFLWILALLSAYYYSNKFIIFQAAFPELQCY